MQKTSGKTGKAAIAVLACATILFAALFFLQLYKNNQAAATGNFTNEMKIPYAVNMDDEGANAYERHGDHPESPYFSKVDFYSAESNDSLTILPRFKTIQQTTWWSCGVSSVLMVLDYYGKQGDWNEETLAALRSDHSAQHDGTCLDQMIEMLERVGGFELETTYGYIDDLESIDLALFQTRLKQGIPILIGWNDWGGHWQIAIGYDDMGTPDYSGDDVLIVADPFDTTDHNQDGYGVYGAERFIYNFTFYDFFPPDHIRDRCFVAVTLTE